MLLFGIRGIPKASSFSLATRFNMTTQSHYEHHTSDSYESAFFYETGDYTKNLCQLVRKRLSLDNNTKKRKILDIGGGTGNFSKMIVAGVDAECVVVDPFLEQTPSSEDGRVSFHKVAAEAFMEKATDQQEWRKQGFHQVLLKEVAHHFATEDRPRIFRGLLEDMTWIGNDTNHDIPSILIITRPKQTDYPLWPEASEVWAKNQPSVDDFVADLKAAGFVDILHVMEPYPCVIEVERWKQMVLSRFWSTFAGFTDNELRTACSDMDEREQDRIRDGRIHFEDRLLFITARKAR